MAQPVKLSDGLVIDARLVGEVAERSIAAQIEFWARLGRTVERVLRTDQALGLKQRGETVSLAQLMNLTSPAERAEFEERFQAQLASRPFPHYEPAPDAPGLLVKIDADGTRTQGRFVNREFRPVER